MNIPPELQKNVCSFLDKTTLKEVRLVCKALDQAAIPLLFDQIFLSDERADLEIADHVVERFGPHLRLLAFHPSYYKPLPSRDEFNALMPDHLRKWCKYYRKRVKKAYRKRRDLTAEKPETNSSGECLAHLCYVLINAPRLSKLVITEFHARSSENEEDSQEYWQSFICPKAGCDLKRM